MSARPFRIPYVCARCLRAQTLLTRRNAAPIRIFTASASPPAETKAVRDDEGRPPPEDAEEQGAMSRRLAELTESNLEEGGRTAAKAIEEASFDDDLKQELLNRIADANYKTENRQAFTQVNTPSSAGRGTRDIAAAEPWTGTESTHDASLRMLDDSYKKIRRPARMPGPAARPPKKVDTGRSKTAASSGARLASARDKTSVYSYLKDDSLSEEEREQMRKQLKERFTPGARSIPATLRGLASLANERIEDAIARGQFKNLPNRGKKIERDYNASSPFLDTTEYFMNKIIQKQDIVPPWIEKQQEVVQTASKFRSRLRADWRRHAARLISSRGGSLQAQIARAEEYARAEAIVNPPQKKEEKLNSVDDDGHVSQISLSGQLQPPRAGESEPVVKISVTEQPISETSSTTTAAAPSTSAPDQVALSTPISDDPRVVDGAVFPFRDPSWEQLEHSYHKAAINELNNLTRSYNLMAPNLAKKPYFSLERELRSCFADTAPLLAREIHQRATAPKVKIEIGQAQAGGVLEKMGGGSARVYDERRPQYGFKEFWRDIFGKKETT